MNLLPSIKHRKVLALILAASLVVHFAVLLVFGAIKFVANIVEEDTVFDVAPVDTPPQYKPEYIVNIESERPVEPDLRQLKILPDSSVAIDIPTMGIDVEFEHQPTQKSATQAAE